MATKYWVGGEGYWDDPSHWSLESGGVSGENEPSSIDDVIFDVNSTSVDMNVYFQGYSYCKSLTCTGISNVITFNLPTYLIIFGNITLDSKVLFKLHDNTPYENIFNGDIEMGIYIADDCILTTNGVEMPTIVCNTEIPVYQEPLM
jgi:hypothetical protein